MAAWRRLPRSPLRHLLRAAPSIHRSLSSGSWAFGPMVVLSLEPWFQGCPQPGRSEEAFPSCLRDVSSFCLDLPDDSSSSHCDHRIPWWPLPLGATLGAAGPGVFQRMSSQGCAWLWRASGDGQHSDRWVGRPAQGLALRGAVQTVRQHGTQWHQAQAAVTGLPDHSP